MGGGIGPEVEQLLIVVVQGEGHVGIDEHDALEGCENVRKLGGIALEELAACRNVVEEVLDTEVAADRTGSGFLADDTGACYAKTGAQLVVGSAGEQLDLGNCGNTGQGLATESHRMEGEEVVGLADFGSGMTLEGQTGIGLRHAAAIVDDLNERATGIDNNDLDRLGTGIDGILDQLLDDRSGTLNDFACCNLIGNGVGEELDEVFHVN